MRTSARRAGRTPDPPVAADGPADTAVACSPAGSGLLSAHLRRPLPTVLVVRPSGVLDEHTAPALEDRVTGQAGSALHIVLDLSAVAPLSAGGVRALLDLDRLATHRGYVLHLVGTEAHSVLRKLFHAGLLHA